MSCFPLLAACTFKSPCVVFFLAGKFRTPRSCPLSLPSHLYEVCLGRRADATHAPLRRGGFHGAPHGQEEGYGRAAHDRLFLLAADARAARRCACVQLACYQLLLPTLAAIGSTIVEELAVRAHLVVRVFRLELLVAKSEARRLLPLTGDLLAAGRELL
eukprot:1589947-Pleurochrysis_carterae.AAC.1